MRPSNSSFLDLANSNFSLDPFMTFFTFRALVHKFSSFLASYSAMLVPLSGNSVSFYL